MKKTGKTTQPAASDAKRQRKLLKLQVREYIERYHPDLGEVSVEIAPGNNVAVVRGKSRDKSR